jgi:hypothetical protein
MIRKLKLLTLVIVLLPVSSIFGEDLPKCDPALEYWYNFYYDPEALDIRVDSAVTDSVRDSQTQNIQIDSMTDTLIPDHIEMEPLLNVESSCINFTDSIPYIWANIEYQGNVAEIEALGVEITFDHHNTAVGRFPLSILPQLNALSSVIFIGDCGPSISPRSIGLTSLDASTSITGADAMRKPPNDSLPLNIVDLSKCGYGLQYIYECFFKHDSLILDSMPNKYSASLDSLTREARKRRNAGFAVDVPAANRFAPRSPLECFTLYLVGNDPYVHLGLSYNRDGSDLDSLGANKYSKTSTLIYEAFPLSSLPMINALSTVQAIHDSHCIVNWDLFSEYPESDSCYRYKAKFAKYPGLYLPLCDSSDTMIEEFLKSIQTTFASCATISVIDNEYYIDVIIVTDGTFDQVDSLGFEDSLKFAKVLITTVPIRKIAHIYSLESVRDIVFNPQLRLD